MVKDRDRHPREWTMEEGWGMCRGRERGKHQPTPNAHYDRQNSKVLKWKHKELRLIHSNLRN